MEPMGKYIRNVGYHLGEYVALLADLKVNLWQYQGTLLPHKRLNVTYSNCRGVIFWGTRLHLRNLREKLRATNPPLKPRNERPERT